jgi:serine phosphatase RsbU (regulator of sigma subunit)
MRAVDKKKLLSQIWFISILVSFAGISILYIYNIYTWRNYPEYGFGYRVATGFDVVGSLTEEGRKAGLQLGDRILNVNDKAFTNYEEYRAARNRKPGDKNSYLVRRGKQEFEITIANLPLGLKRAIGLSGPSYLLGVSYVLIGTLVFLMKPHHRASWVFFLFASVFGLFLTFVERAGRLTPFWFETLEIFAYAFTPTVFIHLAFTFPQERRILKKYPKAQLLPYMASALLFLCIRFVTPTMSDAPKPLLKTIVTYGAIGVLFFLGSCIQLWLKSSSDIERVRAKMILLGFGITASLPLTDFVLNGLFQVYIAPSLNYYLPFFITIPLSIGYSIVKHDLFDFDTIIRRTYGYLLTTGAIACSYGLFVLFTNLAFGGLAVSKSPAFPLIFILAVVFLFNPVRNRMQKFIDRVFYRLEYDYQETVQKISETMRSLLNLDQVGKAIMDTALGTMFIDSGGVMLFNPKEEAYECLIKAGERERREGKLSTLAIDEREEDSEHALILTGEGEATETKEQDERLAELKLPLDEPFIQKLAERKKEVTVYDIEEDPFFEGERESCKRTLEWMEATLIVPLIYEDRLTGLLSLGQKKSGKFYRREDINLLNILANQGAVAIENALMVEDVIEKERMEEELSIARDLQMSMLPASCPEIRGFEVAATSIQAREVGGDFFDFIEMGEDRVGFVIGDVTGKSVTGALVMSASRSVFRMLSEEELTVGEIMVRANRRMKKDIKSGMFVALLYAVLDAKDVTVSLCSAGQTQPIYLSVETGEARLLETEGDTFPLGILEDAEYQETRLQLAPGDKVIFYTDGIVEEMNEDKEIFGFERLLNVVQKAQAMNADSLLQEITERVAAFAGGVAQHDDLTVIVVSVE